MVYTCALCHTAEHTADCPIGRYEKSPPIFREEIDPGAVFYLNKDVWLTLDDIRQLWEIMSDEQRKYIQS